MLEGFKKFDMAIGTSTISINEHGVAFSKACVVRLGKPKYVEFLIDYSNKKVAVKVASEETEGAFPFYNPEKKVVSVRWNNKDLLNEIENLMEWDFAKDGYKAYGEYIPDEQATVFDLKSASRM
ncbi:hypothetical protein SAMN02745687_00214 [Lachnospiraceae bacterium NK3A20]|nr:hypothetical protein SAMN02745687_00214 [Lachnospiraceae bacterium NK3A20]